MKAQAMGAIPITSRHENSTLRELAGEFDLGPPERPGSIALDEKWQAEYAASVIAAAGASGKVLDKIEKHRKLMIDSSRKRFLWSHVASIWHESFQRGGERKNGYWTNSDLEHFYGEEKIENYSDEDIVYGRGKGSIRPSYFGEIADLYSAEYTPVFV